MFYGTLLKSSSKDTLSISTLLLFCQTIYIWSAQCQITMLTFQSALNWLNIIFLIVLPKLSVSQRAVVKKASEGFGNAGFGSIVFEMDYRAHIDYTHMNPVKHGYVERVQDWRYSSFHRFVADSLLPVDWDNWIGLWYIIIGCRKLNPTYGLRRGLFLILLLLIIDN